MFHLEVGEQNVQDTSTATEGNTCVLIKSAFTLIKKFY